MTRRSPSSVAAVREVDMTKPHMKRVVLALLVGATIGASAGAEENLQKLTGAQIRAKIAGMELTDQIHWRDLYERNGRVTSSSMGRKRTGTWRVEKDQLCVEYDKEPPAKCYDVWSSGKKVELRGEGLLPLDGVIEAPTGRK
jgi:hypothetical protein